jgi:mRNA interferase YafQ
MRTTIERSNAFKRDYRRELKTHGRLLRTMLEDVLLLLATDVTLSPSCQDHKLSGDWIGCRDCHLKPDLILIYEKSGEDTLRLARLGSHAELDL